MIRAWRRGMTNDPRHPKYVPMLRWRVGRLPAWQAHPTVIEHYLYRGSHRAHQFSITVEDIKASLKSRKGWQVEYIDGKPYLTIDAVFYGVGNKSEHTFLAVAQPGGGIANFPALVTQVD